MMSRTIAHEHRTHPYTAGIAASGFIGAGGTARFVWDGEVWRPDGRTDAAVFAGSLTDTELRHRLAPDLATILALGPHWADHAHARYTRSIEED